MNEHDNIVAAIEWRSDPYMVSLTPRPSDGPCIFADGEEVEVTPAKSKSLMIVEAPFSLEFYDAHYIIESR